MDTLSAKDMFVVQNQQPVRGESVSWTGVIVHVRGEGVKLCIFFKISATYRCCARTRKVIDHKVRAITVRDHEEQVGEQLSLFSPHLHRSQLIIQ